MGPLADALKIAGTINVKVLENIEKFASYSPKVFRIKFSYGEKAFDELALVNCHSVLVAGSQNS